MKLAILHPFLLRYRRGIERFTWSLAKALASRGVEVDVLTWSWPREVDWGYVPDCVRIIKMPYFRYFMHRIAILYHLRWLMYGLYDWIMIFFAGYGEAETMMLLQKLRTQRYCIVFHFPREQVPHRYREFERFNIVYQANCVVAVSKYVANGVKKHFGRKCAVIGNGVDTCVFRPIPKARMKVRQQLGIDVEAPVIISLTALEERKGVQWVLRAMPYLLKEFYNLHYVVLGEGPYRVELEKIIQQLGINHHVSLLGRVDDVVPFLSAADIGCLLSYGEAFPIALLEYMAMELPVITSRHPPFDELLPPEAGVMVDEKDTRTLVQEILTLLSSPERRYIMGKNGREYVLAHHTWDRVAEAYLSLFLRN